MSQTLRAWLKASRPFAQLYICIPLIVGQLYAHSAGYILNAWVFLWVQLFGLSIQVYIVYANDYADEKADRINHTFTPYSGGSRVLVDGELSRSALGRAAIFTAFAAVGTALMLGFLWERWLTVALALAAILLLHLYSYWPGRFNYRGGGEILQTIGMGIILPVFGWYAQAGTLIGFPIRFFAVLLPTMLACAIGTSLPDESSDRESQKRSATVLLGQRPAQIIVIILHTISIVLLLLIFKNQTGGALSSLSLLALFTITAQFLFFGGKPGSARLLRFGIASILTTLLIMLASAIFPPAPPYNFLVLCFLLGIPAVAAYGLRPDLRPALRWMALASLPFAFTESFFLQVYWSPEFLFHLGSRWGFGIEDFLFVAFLGMLTYAAYPIVFQKKLRITANKTRRITRFLPLVLGGLALAIILSSSLIPIIHATWCVMGLFVLATWAARRDLIGPSCASGAVMAIGYGLICLEWQIFYPGIFRSTWNQEALCGFFLWSVPIEELLYAGTAGMSGVLLYPLLTNREFLPRSSVADVHKSTCWEGPTKTTDTLFDKRKTR